MSPSSASSKLIQSYYATAKPLLEYIESIANTTEPILQDDDDASYRTLIQNAWIGIQDPLQDGRVFDYEIPSLSQNELVDKAQTAILRAAKTQRTKNLNVMTMGYAHAGPDRAGYPSRPDRPHIVNFFPNTNVTFLKGREMQKLLARIGSDAMSHLLLSTSLFISLPNDCFCQVLGQPIFERTLLQPISLPSDKAQEVYVADESEDRPAKRRRIDAGDLKSDKKDDRQSNLAAGDVQFARARILYAQPLTAPGGRFFVVGLPPSHALNNWNHRHAHVTADTRARNLLKHIFPVEYKISGSLAELSTKKRNAKFKQRQQEIDRLGRGKTPKRLKSLIPLAAAVLKRHDRCRYRALRSLACPSKLNQERDKSLDSSILLELMSETPIKSQLSFDMSMVTFASKSKLSSSPAKPRFAEFTCSHNEVFRFVSLATRCVLPQMFWGSKHNQRVILKAVQTFIKCRRFETLTLHTVLQGIRTSDCDWLLPDNHAARHQRMTVTDAKKRRTLLEQFIYWYFDDFVIPLLRTNFYVTESGAYRNRLLYFRHDDWKTLCKPLVNKLKEGTFVVIPAAEAKQHVARHQLGYSSVRLLPKETGVRPIVNLSRKRALEHGGYQSINRILHGAFQILGYEQIQQRERMAATVYGHSEMHEKLLGFKTWLTRDGAKIPKLYFAKVDVRACFDSIDQTKLLEIITDILTSDRYMVQKYARVGAGLGDVRRSFRSKALPEGERTHFIHQATKLAEALRHHIFVDQVVYSFQDKEEVLNLLKEHITDNIIRIGNEYYRQVVGIPQGSVISTLLCNFFYGDLERKKLKFTEDPQCLLMRLVDDYLFITTDLEKAVLFLTTMSQGHPEYGCLIAKEKTLKNFPLDEFDFGDMLDVSETNFPWCGNFIDTRDLSVSVDFTRLREFYVGDTLTVERNRKPGKALLIKMLHAVKQRTHKIYTDPALNSSRVLHMNAYQNMVNSAMKMRSYMKSLGVSAERNPKHIEKCIRETVAFSWSLLRKKWIVKRELRQSNVLWLGFHAFHTVLKRKPSGFTSVLRFLEAELKAACYAVAREKFAGLVQEALGVFEGVRY